MPGTTERIEIVGTRGSLEIAALDGTEERLDTEGPTGAGLR